MRRPVSVTALSLFFFFGATLAGLAAVSLVFPGRVLEAMWRLDPRGHEVLGRMHGWGALLLAAVSMTCTVLAVGLWHGRRWNYAAVISLLAFQVADDILRMVARFDPHVIVGDLIVLGGLALYLSTPDMRARLGSERP